MTHSAAAWQKTYDEVYTWKYRNNGNVCVHVAQEKKVNFFIKLNYSFPEKNVCFIKNKLSFAIVERYIGFIHFVKSSQPSRAYSYKVS